MLHVGVVCSLLLLYGILWCDCTIIYYFAIDRSFTELRETFYFT